MGLAVQMYTVRDFTTTAAGFVQTIGAIRAIGYEAVQLSAVGAMAGDRPAVTAVQARRLLDDHGLKCIATHRSWDSLVNNVDAEIDFHHILGCNFAAIGGLPNSYSAEGAEGYRAWLRDAAPIIHRLKEAGIAFGYHNHSQEFQHIGSLTEPRRTLFDIFIEEGGIDLKLEIDVYWVQHAGINPARLFERCLNRAPVIHLKDKEVVPGDGPVMAPIGEGNLEWDSILSSTIMAGVEWYAVEQDVCRRDPFDCLRSSFNYLSALGI